MGINTRKTVLARLVALFQTMTPGAGYVGDWSAAGTVALMHDSEHKVRENGLERVIRIAPGAEASDPAGAFKGVLKVNFAARCEVLVRQLDGSSVVDKLEDAIGDIRRCLDTHQNLALAGDPIVDRSWVAQVLDPQYDTDGSVATVDVLVMSTWDYQLGQDF